MYFDNFKADSRLASSQWGIELLCNDVSHYLGTNLESQVTESQCFDVSRTNCSLKSQVVDELKTIKPRWYHSIFLRPGLGIIVSTFACIKLGLLCSWQWKSSMNKSNAFLKVNLIWLIMPVCEIGPIFILQCLFTWDPFSESIFWKAKRKYSKKRTPVIGNNNRIFWIKNTRQNISREQEIKLNRSPQILSRNAPAMCSSTWYSWTYQGCVRWIRWISEVTEVLKQHVCLQCLRNCELRTNGWYITS